MIRFVTNMNSIPRPGEPFSSGIAPRFASSEAKDTFQSSAAGQMSEIVADSRITGIQPIKKFWGGQKMPTLEQALRQGINISSPLLGLPGQTLQLSLSPKDGQPRAEIEGKTCRLSRTTRNWLDAELPNGRKVALQVGDSSNRLLISSGQPKGWSSSLDLTPGQTVPHAAQITVDFDAPEHGERGLDRLKVAEGRAEVSRSSLFGETPCEEFILHAEVTTGERANLGREIDDRVSQVLKGL